jgi:hypothetical protein
MANIYGGESSWLWDEAGKKGKSGWGSKKSKDSDMVTPGLLPESELKEHLKELTHEQRQVVLKEQELYRARVMIRRQERLKEFVKSSGFKDQPKGRGRISATLQFVVAMLDLLSTYERDRLAVILEDGGASDKKVRRPRYMPEDEATILRMAAEGHRDKEIARAIQRPLPSVSRKRKELQANQASSAHSTAAQLPSAPSGHED